MEHLAIMRKSWGLTPKILQGKKKIESRWYKNKYSPWGKIQKGETVYFKDTGEPVTIRAIVKKVIQIENLNKDIINNILKEYGKDDGIDNNDIPKYIELFKDKKYCLLIFLEDAKAVEPFQISKKGYGAMSAWITVDNIEKLKVS
jgi:hypothetical protein